MHEIAHFWLGHIEETDYEEVVNKTTPIWLGIVGWFFSVLAK